MGELAPVRNPKKRVSAKKLKKRGVLDFSAAQMSHFRRLWQVIHA